MTSWILLLLSFLSISGNCVSDGRDDYSHLIFPNKEEKICLVVADNADQKMLSGEKVAAETTLTKRIMEELDYPYHQSVIKLNQCSRNLSNNNDGPNVLLLSLNQGGFPRHGLIMTHGGETFEYPNLNYVDLVIDEQALDKGQLYIFSHELGHVMMMNIWPEFGDTAGDHLSSKQHVSMGVTDYYVAFFEGWGISFETFADTVDRYHKSFTSSYDYDRFQSSLRHSNVDREMRVNSVLQNEYIYLKSMPSNIPEQSSPESLILLEHTSPMFDKTRLKNAQQMLSCEGVIATIFYRINSNEKLRNSYADRAFYQRFLCSDMPEEVDPREIFTPFENVILKNFWVWRQMSMRSEKNRDSALFIEFIKEWCRSFPEDREEILTLFAALTVGKTMTNEPGEIYEIMAYYGLIGDYFKYLGRRDRYVEFLKAHLQKLLKNEMELDENVGPELWATNKDFLIRQVLWMDDNKIPLAINLNTASQYEIATLPGVTAQTAKQIVKAREERGFFESFEDLEPFGVALKP
jgi:hypothetical protein